MAQSEGKELQLIDAALDRMHAGTYGKCEDCERDIPTVRLEAVPCASRCIACQRSLEGGVPIMQDNPQTSVGNELAT